MKIVVQRCDNASVVVSGNIVGKINQGLTILVGFTEGDNEEIINYIVNKIINLRIFDDERHIMNKSILDIKGEVLSVSQFTLYGETKNGNRPSYVKAMSGDKASCLYQMFNDKLKKYVNVQEGIFGSDMLVNLTNNGPVTIIIER